MENLTDEQRQERIGALTRELQHHEKYGQDERAQQVKDELGKLGAEGRPPAKRSKKATPKKRTEL